MGGLADALRERIRADGPISVETYMAACNQAYYASRDPLGLAGDFTTAPEIHQMFGERVGACLADCWQRAGAPADAVYAELGPGRGTLARDALRVLAAAGFGGGAHLVEISPALRAAQARLVPGATFHQSIADLPPAPLLVVANEFLDALPVRQWVGAEERRVTLADDGLAFEPAGPVRETAPERDAAVAAIAAHLARHGGVALLIDYGHGASAPGDTLQAVKRHRFADPLDQPGEQDLTAHVDFAAAARAASAAGAKVSRLAEQGAWLRALGIAERAERLAGANPGRRGEITAAIERLTSKEAMGALFKVLALAAPGWPMPAGLAQ